MARPALSQAEVEARREGVLKYALEEASDGGAEAITVRGVARRLGWSPMALYRYFPGGRDEILAALRGRGFDALAVHLQRAVRVAEGPIERIVGLMVAGTHFASSEPTLYRLMYEVTQGVDHQGSLAAKRRAAWAVVSAVFSEAAEAGAIEGGGETVPHVFFAAAHGAIALERSRQPYDERRMKQLLASMLKVLLRGAGVGEPVLGEVPALIEGALSRLRENGEIQ